jgi:hypothetical protein
MNHSGCSLMALLASLTAALFLEAWGRLRSGGWVCLVLATAAILLLFYRRAVVIDPERRQVTLIRRWFIPVTSRRTVPIDRLTVRLERPRSDSPPSVWLDDTGGAPFRIHLNSAENAEESARRLSADLGRPLVVRSS